MNSNFKKNESTDINDQQLYDALLSENFEKLVELQKKNEENMKKKYFFSIIKKILKENNERNKKLYPLETIKTLLSNLKTKISEYIISINDFQIEDKIGFGGNSIVYKGKYKFIDSAIKKISLQTTYTKGLLNIINEILLLQKLRHPNIIMLLGVAIDNEKNLYIITELYPKYSLQDFIQKNKGKMPLKLKIEILFDIARGLNYLHQLDPPILHRDLKPHNIFINSNFKAKIGDFGLAKEFNSDNDSIKNTDTVSTLEYMSPETLNESIYYKESDIYSFGILIYEVLREEYFIDKKGFQIINAILIKKYRPSLDFLEDQDLKRLVKCCWEDDWKMRPSFNKVCEDLTFILSKF